MPGTQQAYVMAFRDKNLFGGRGFRDKQIVQYISLRINYFCSL